MRENKNPVHAYNWAHTLLEGISANGAPLVRDLHSGRAGRPIFVVMGACPNAFCGMQAVMYARMDGEGDAVDFWWIKPQAGGREELETATLDRHVKGAHKNDPGRSRQLYGQFAALFDGSTAGGMGQLRFGIEEVGGDVREHWRTGGARGGARGGAGGAGDGGAHQL